MPPISRGFRGRRRPAPDPARVPPGQHLVNDHFRLLTFGPTPRTPLDRWSFSIDGAVSEGRRWTWQEFRLLPREHLVKDIHCVTSWSKLDTRGAARLRRHAARRHRAGRRLRNGLVRRRLHHQPADRRRDRRQGVDRRRVRRHRARARSWRPGPAARAAPLLLEEREVGARPHDQRARRARVLEQNGYHDHGDPWKEERYGRTSGERHRSVRVAPGPHPGATTGESAGDHAAPAGRGLARSCGRAAR